MNSENYDLASEVAEEVLIYNDSNKRLLKLVSDILLKILMIKMLQNIWKN